MKLGFDKIIPAVCGAAKTVENAGKLWFYRFTDAQSEAYRERSADFFRKTKATAGVRLEFSTDSSTLSLEGECFVASSRNFYNFDIYANGSLVYHKLEYVTDGYARYSVDVELGGKDQKNVSVYFPWCAQANLESISIDDGASFAPVKRPYKLLCFGDSITHGYDALNPSFTYASRLADMLRADHINKGIGGEIFFPTLAELKDDIEPDYITVAYGTNDWVCVSKDEFDKNSRSFYEMLSTQYPNAKIFALAPVWRESCECKTTALGAFSDVAITLKNIANSLPNVIFIDCVDFIPHERAYYSPDVLHPNDAGFHHYAAGVFAEIKKHI